MVMAAAGVIASVAFGVAREASAQSIAFGPFASPATGNLYYRLSSSNWTDAEAMAVSMGGHLAAVGSVEENTFLRDAFGRRLTGSEVMWIGLNDFGVEGTLTWTSGEPITYVNWAPGQPVNMDTRDCVMMGRFTPRWTITVDSPNPAGSPAFGIVELPCAPVSVIRGPIFNPANGHIYYKLSPSTWQDAECFAGAHLGGSLVRVDDGAEDGFVRDYFMNAPGFGGAGGLWIQASDIVADGAYIFNDGEPLEYFNWEAGQPDNDPNEHFVLIHGASGQWRNAANFAEAPGVGAVHGVVEVSSCAGGIGIAQGPFTNPVNGHTYYRLTTTSRADAECYAVTQMLGHLVSISDAQENEFVLSTFGGVGGVNQLWLGATDELNEGEFAWSSGEKLAYTNWTPGQPDNGMNEDYIVMSTTTGQWRDAVGAATLPEEGPVYAIVEVDGFPCRCDWNENGVVNSQDMFDYLTDFYDPTCPFCGDFNYDGITNSQDFFDFFSCFFSLPQGCV